MKSQLIKDSSTREAVRELERKLEKIQQIPQIPISSDIVYVINVLNKITDSLKR